MVVTTSSFHLNLQTRITQVKDECDLSEEPCNVSVIEHVLKSGTVRSKKVSCDRVSVTSVSRELYILGLQWRQSSSLASVQQAYILYIQSYIERDYNV